MSSNAQRLAAAALARRHELDLSQMEVWQAGGPSNTTLTKVENGLLESLTRITARKLDEGLAWEPGSARRVWLGGEAVPVRRDKLGDLRDMLQEIEQLSMRETTRDYIRANIEAELARQDQANNPNRAAN